MANPLKTLQESVIKNFENGAKGSVVPTFHVGVDSFFAGTKGDLPAEKMVLLKGDLAKIAKAMAEGMELTVAGPCDWLFIALRCPRREGRSRDAPRRSSPINGAMRNGTSTRLRLREVLGLKRGDQARA